MAHPSAKSFVFRSAVIATMPLSTQLTFQSNVALSWELRANAHHFCYLSAKRVIGKFPN